MSKKGTRQILLCGFMGCGKTSVGQALAFRLKWDFLDTDTMIEKRQGCSIPQIFQQQGEEAFRQMEEETARLLGKRKNTVISTGGGFMNASLFPPEIADIISGIIIYLCAFSLLFKNLIVTLFTGKHKKAPEPAKTDAKKPDGKEAQ